MAMLNIPSASANRNDDGIYSWEKTIKDVNNIDETFANARDAGFLRLNQARLSVVANLSAKYDSKDIFKVQVQSNGKLSLGIRTGEGEDESVLDLSKYQDKLDEAEQMIDPEGWAKKQAEENDKFLNQSLLERTAPGLKIKVYMKKGNKTVLVADSAAEKGSKNYENMDKILTGEYRATKGDYYVEIERDDTVESKKELPYAMQLQLGKSYKHDYLVTEAPSDDVKNKKISTIPLTNTTYGITNANALEIQASKYMATASMLSDAYLNMANIIYTKNSKY